MKLKFWVTGTQLQLNNLTLSNNRNKSKVNVSLCAPERGVEAEKLKEFVYRLHNRRTIATNMYLDDYKAQNKMPWVMSCASSLIIKSVCGAIFTRFNKSDVSFHLHLTVLLVGRSRRVCARLILM